MFCIYGFLFDFVISPSCVMCCFHFLLLSHFPPCFLAVHTCSESASLAFPLFLCLHLFQPITPSMFLVFFRLFISPVLLHLTPPEPHPLISCVCLFSLFLCNHPVLLTGCYFLFLALCFCLALVITGLNFALDLCSVLGLSFAIKSFCLSWSCLPPVRFCV